MAEVVDMLDKIKRFYRFSRYELRGIIISILVIAFIVSFNEWGSSSAFEPAIGLFNLFNAILIVALSILFHDAGQRLWGLAMGYRVEFKMWTFGLIASLALAFINNGRIPYLWLIAPSGFTLHLIAGHRLGWFRYNINYFGQAMVALAGPLFTLMLVLFLKVLYIFSPTPLILLAIRFNVIYAIISLLPIPPLDGSKIYFGSRMLYAFSLPTIIISTILLAVNVPILLALIVSFLVGIILWMTYYITFERKLWRGPQ